MIPVRSLLLFCMVSPVCCAQRNAAAAKTADLGLTAVGRQHHPIHTSSKEAQEYFDQGITLLYGFNHEEAERAFEKAAQLDSASPMPLWGIAMAVGPNYNSSIDAEREKLAFETIQKAKKLGEHRPALQPSSAASLATHHSPPPQPPYQQ